MERLDERWRERNRKETERLWEGETPKRARNLARDAGRWSRGGRSEKKRSGAEIQSLQRPGERSTQYGAGSQNSQDGSSVSIGSTPGRGLNHSRPTPCRDATRANPQTDGTAAKPVFARLLLPRSGLYRDSQRRALRTLPRRFHRQRLALRRRQRGASATTAPTNPQRLPHNSPPPRPPPLAACPPAALSLPTPRSALYPAPLFSPLGTGDSCCQLFDPLRAEYFLRMGATAATGPQGPRRVP